MSELARMVVISGPSGVGKTTLVARLRADARVWWSVSATTRPQREGEVEGEDYYFLTDADFLAKVDAGGFLEHATVHGHYYGTQRAPVEEALAAGKLPLLDLDVQGGKSVMKTDMPATFIFIKPPSIKELEERLVGRQTDDRPTITRRIQRAHSELDSAILYDHQLVNDDVESTLAKLVETIETATGIRLEPGPAE